jgi:glutaconate CoA-transferase, subunit A
MEFSKRKSKVVSMEQAASMVKEGMMIYVGGGHSHNAPAAFMRQLIRQGTKNITLVPGAASGYQTDVILGTGQIKTLYMSYVGLDYIGIAPNFKRLAESGRLDIIEFDEMGLWRGLKAAGAGIAFFALPDGMRAVDIVRINPDFYKEIVDPFTGKKVIIVPPITPDIAVIHVPQCDAYGNGRELGRVEEVAYQAAKQVIVTTEEVVSLEETQAHYREVSILGRLVDAVVEVPYGSHPGECHGYYQHDPDHLKEYQKAARDDESYKGYLDKYVYGCKNQNEYLEKVGIVSKIPKLRYF